MDPELKQAETNKTAVELVEWAALGTALLLLTVSENYGAATVAALILLTALFVERAIQGKLSTKQTGLELPLLLFVLSAASSALISYNEEAALLQFARILASAAAFFILSDSRKLFSQAAAALFTFAAASLALYWPVQHDFHLSPGKLTFINSIGRLINELIPAIPGPEIHSNVAAGVLLAGIPISLSLLFLSWNTHKRLLALVSAILSVLLLFGLVMTSSRGAWIGLGGMSMTGLTIYAFQKSQFMRRNAKSVLFFALLILCAAIVLLGFLKSPSTLFGKIPDPNGSLQSRWDLWKEGFILIQDYIFTGSGLQSFWMVHAVYALLIHVPFLAHIHNSFLQIWIEQGILGAVSVMWGAIVIFTWVWRSIKNGSGSILGWAGVAALCGAAIHGMVDVVFYVERTLPVIGILLGFTAQLSGDRSERSADWRKGKSDIIHNLVIVGVPVLLLVLFNQPLSAMWYANLGAIKQTQVELRMYDPRHFDDPTVDQVRQKTDLSSAEIGFKKALEIRNTNKTALHRLSMIALARQDYDQALDWMEISWQAGHRDSRTRLLYADALVAAGEPEKAAETISGLPWAESRLMGQAWSRYWINQDIQRASYAFQAILGLNPNNNYARDSLLQLRQILQK